jgi:hypothetical protein
MLNEIKWDPKGGPIKVEGVYTGIPIEDYHNNLDLLDGPSISKSALKHCAPNDGSPKEFWAYWAHNPDHVDKPKTQALTFGSAVHAALLGDEVFKEKFVVRPAELLGKPWQGNRKVCKEWMEEMTEMGLMVLSRAEIEQIKRMAEDASKYPLVEQGILNGRVERTMLFKHHTGIWLRNRPDVIPTESGMFVDLKSTSSLGQRFLARQIEDNGYYLQAALTRMACRALDIPFEAFVLLYALSKDYADTDHRILSDFDLDRGERVIDECLRQIKYGMETGVWLNNREAWGKSETISMGTGAEYIDEALSRSERREMK